MSTPAAKDFSTAQAQAALRGLVLAQVPAAADAVPVYRITGFLRFQNAEIKGCTQVDFTDWAQVSDFLKGTSHA
jgi:hypothetical protein